MLPDLQKIKGNPILLYRESNVGNPMWQHEKSWIATLETTYCYIGNPVLLHGISIMLYKEITYYSTQNPTLQYRKANVAAWEIQYVGESVSHFGSKLGDLGTQNPSTMFPKSFKNQLKSGLGGSWAPRAPRHQKRAKTRGKWHPKSSPFGNSFGAMLGPKI